MHRLLFCHPLPPLLQSKSTSIWVHQILRLDASAQKNVYAIKNIGALWNFTKHLYPNFPEPYRVPAPETSGTSPGIWSEGICTETLQNLSRYLHLNFLEPSGIIAWEPCATSPAICIETLWNLTRYLHWNPPEPRQVSAPEPSRNSTGICTGTLRNPSGTLPGSWRWSCTGSHQS